MLKDNYKKISLSKDNWKRKVSTLCWRDDVLVDYVGLNRYSLTGEIINGNISWAYKFDRAISSSDGKYSVLFENYGTKGLVLEGDKLIREINRSYYCADAYEYPVTFFTSPDGQICLAHCPEEYNIIEIEDLKTGERLTDSDRESHDFFHSRLQVSQNGNYLISAGWVWHPVDMVEVYDLSNISSPEFFNLYHDEELNLFELNSAAFINNTTVAVTGNGEDEKEKFICIYEIEQRKVLSKAKLSEPAGNLMNVDENFVIGFYEHPKLINIKTGEIVKKWANIFSGKQNSSISSQDAAPPIAIDVEQKRFAVADEDFIHVVSLE